MKKDHLKMVVLTLICTAIGLGVFLYFFQPMQVRNSSMEPHFFDGDLILVSRQAYRKSMPGMGEVIIFREKSQEKKKGRYLIKRVVGEEKDFVTIKDGDVYVNGRKIDDTVSKDGFTLGRMNNHQVDKNCVFVLGDNRQGSVDSRHKEIGDVEADSIVGRVVFRFFPLGKRFGYIKKEI